MSVCIVIRDRFAEPLLSPPFVWIATSFSAVVTAAYHADSSHVSIVLSTISIIARYVYLSLGEIVPCMRNLSHIVAVLQRFLTCII